jgi:hypothetical protein
MIYRGAGRIRCPVVRWMVVPVPAISWVARIIHRSRVVPDDGWAIASDPTPSPRAVVVVDTAAAPTPTPATPTPGLITVNKGSDPDTYSEGDERRRYNRTCRWRNVDHGGVVLRYEDHLGICRLDHIDRLIRDLLYLNLLLFIATQRS